MKGLGISVPPLHAGVRSDLEVLLAAFKAKNSIRFEAFGQVFSALNMSLIFAGRQSAAELVEFEEHLLQLSSAYMMSVKSAEIAGFPEKSDPIVELANSEAPEYNRSERAVEKQPEHDGNATSFVERMFGIYCTYAFFYLQPKDYEAQIRISPAQMRDITDFLDQRLRPEKHLDALGCLYKLLNGGAFRITAFESVHDPACHKRYEAEDEDECCLPPATEKPLARMQSLVEDTTMQQLEVLQQRYEESKVAAGLTRISHNDIDVVKGAHRILNSAKEVIQMAETGEVLAAGRGGGNAGATPVPALISTGSSSRLDLKKKAYASGVQASRHRRYAFAQGDETVALSDAESDEEKAGTSKKKAMETPKKKAMETPKKKAMETPKKKAMETPKKRGRPPRKSQLEEKEKADEVPDELQPLEVEGVVKRKRGRPSRKSQLEETEKADEVQKELHAVGVEGVVTRKNATPRKSAAAENPDAILGEFLGRNSKRVNKNEAKKKTDPVVPVSKSKNEQNKEREMAKVLEEMKEEEWEEEEEEKTKEDEMKKAKDREMAKILEEIKQEEEEEEGEKGEAEEDEEKKKEGDEKKKEEEEEEKKKKEEEDEKKKEKKEKKEKARALARELAKLVEELKSDDEEEEEEDEEKEKDREMAKILEEMKQEEEE